MIEGTVTDDGVPIVSIEVAGATYPGIIDTGFNGDLELPESLRSQVNARFICRAESLLAGGVTIEEEVFLVTFPFDGRRLRAHATFVAEGDDILIGTHLLGEYRLSINFFHRTIRLQRLNLKR